jgi:hypothetical protein
MSFDVDGKLHTADGYVKFEPVRGRLGGFPLKCDVKRGPATIRRGPADPAKVPSPTRSFRLARRKQLPDRYILIKHA